MTKICSDELYGVLACIKPVDILRAWIYLPFRGSLNGTGAPCLQEHDYLSAPKVKTAFVPAVQMPFSLSILVP
jgi:hypothetical protein